MIFLFVLLYDALVCIFSFVSFFAFFFCDAKHISSNLTIFFFLFSYNSLSFNITDRCDSRLEFRVMNNNIVIYPLLLLLMMMTMRTVLVFVYIVIMINLDDLLFYS